ncbi:hypothetical protein E1283_33770 [Streptomyces hainanensis]|uniref:Uncharacterized protein n=2 Tax=Streptomyces hainanensis TaxID=402648 RepID=A0A4V2XZX7_9ACTN|nr:hypothetical protein E1283_33770 [Streptomyces hainanensis]
MHLSGAHGSHPREPGAEQFARAAETLALLADRTRLTLLHTLNSEPFEAGWLFRVRIDESAEPARLMSAAEYDGLTNG